MKCPNCGKLMKKNFCLFCGYMTNGNIVKKNTNYIFSDLEIYLGKDYDKIYRNNTYFSTFLFGPLYLCYRGFFILGILGEIISLFLIAVSGYIGGQIHFLNLNFSSVFLITSIIIDKIFWMTLGNIIYMELLKMHIKKIKIKKGDKYLQVIQNKKIENNLILPLLAIAFILLLLIFFIIIYRTVNGTF